MVKLSIRIDLAPVRAVGPGKIRLLELVGDTGSISAAGRAMDMSYRRAWLLIDALESEAHQTVRPHLRALETAMARRKPPHIRKDIADAQ